MFYICGLIFKAMDLQELLKDLKKAASKHCALKDGVVIHSEGAKYIQEEKLEDCYVEQRVVVSFTRIVRSSDNEFGNLIDSVLLKNGVTCVENQWNYQTLLFFKASLLKYLNESELEIRNGSIVMLRLEVFREILSDKLPFVMDMLPKDLYIFVARMLDEMDLKSLSEYRYGHIEPYFAFFLEDIKELGVSNPSFEK